MKRSGDYTKGFKHGAKWALAMVYAKNQEIQFDIAQAIAALKKGR